MKRILSALALSTTAALFAAPAMADDDARIYEQNKDQYISQAKAGEIAQAHVKGVSVKKVDFDHDNRLGAHFDAEVLADRGVEYDVSVDARTGKVLKSEVED